MWTLWGLCPERREAHIHSKMELFHSTPHARVQNVHTSQSESRGVDPFLHRFAQLWMGEKECEHVGRVLIYVCMICVCNLYVYVCRNVWRWVSCQVDLCVNVCESWLCQGNTAQQYSFSLGPVGPLVKIITCSANIFTDAIYIFIFSYSYVLSMCQKKNYCVNLQ